MPPREALVFDMYGTLVDTNSIRHEIEQMLPQQGQRVFRPLAAISTGV